MRSFACTMTMPPIAAERMRANTSGPSSSSRTKKPDVTKMESSVATAMLNVANNVNLLNDNEFASNEDGALSPRSRHNMAVSTAVPAAVSAPTTPYAPFFHCGVSEPARISSNTPPSMARSGEILNQSISGPTNIFAANIIRLP